MPQWTPNLLVNEEFMYNHIGNVTDIWYFIFKRPSKDVHRAQRFSSARLLSISILIAVIFLWLHIYRRLVFRYKSSLYNIIKRGHHIFNSAAGIYTNASKFQFKFLRKLLQFNCFLECINPVVRNQARTLDLEFNYQLHYGWLWRCYLN